MRANCQSGVWETQFKKSSYRTVASPYGNLLGDAAFAGCNDNELVIGGGGSCSILTGTVLAGGMATAISSMPVLKGQIFPYAGFGIAPNNGWYYDCNGNPGIGGIAIAIVACVTP